jgi:hypothetical protein
MPHIPRILRPVWPTPDQLDNAVAAVVFLAALIYALGVAFWGW